MIIKTKSVAVDINAGVSSVPNADNIGATLVSLINTHSAPALITVNPDNHGIYIAAGERVVIQKEPASELDGTAGGAAVWATAVGFTN